MSSEKIIQEIRENLIRSDGRLNSPALVSNKYTDLIQRIVDETGYLTDTASIAQRWWHLTHGPTPPVCENCSNTLTWISKYSRYNRFCCQRCAVTSEEASQRTSKQFSGVIISPERIKRAKQTRSERGYYTNRASTVEKLSVQKRGDKNPQFGKKPWNFQLPREQNPMYGRKRPGTGLSGELNPQYGKSPSPRAGRGINGRFGSLFFRSSLELMYLIYWHESGVLVESAETQQFRVDYIGPDQLPHTYSPDYVLDNTQVVELKPEKLHTNDTVLKKFNALTTTHGKSFECLLLGYKNIGSHIRDYITEGKIDSYIESNILQMKQTQLNRLRKNYADIIRSTF